jgi:hypothetical protein
MRTSEVFGLMDDPLRHWPVAEKWGLSPPHGDMCLGFTRLNRVRKGAVPIFQQPASPFWRLVRGIFRSLVESLTSSTASAMIRPS